MHNFSAESKKTESPIAISICGENVGLLCSERITINFTFPDLFFVKNQYLNLLKNKILKSFEQ